MKYKVRYIFSMVGQTNKDIGEYLIDNPSNCLEKIKEMSFKEDSLYIYNIESGESLDVEFKVTHYYVKDLMENGFYQKTCNYDELVYILNEFSNPYRDPTTYGMESFG